MKNYYLLLKKNANECYKLTIYFKKFIKEDKIINVIIIFFFLKWCQNFLKINY